MTQRIRNVATYIIPLLMCVCVLGMTRWALLQEHQLLEQSSNKGVSGEEIPSTLRRRLQLQLAAKNRGSILDRTGYILASTSNGIRQYADEYSSHVVGYVSHNGIGQVGLEATQEQQLLGSQKWQNDWLELINQPTYGQDIQLTINHRLQAEIATTLNGRAGAAVVINANDGAVYGIISSPTYDTNQFLNDPTYSPTLQDDQSQFNRAVEGLYTPGSTWKTISLIAALDSGLLSADHLFEFGEPHYDEEGLYYTCTFEDKSIIDRNHTEAQLTLADAFALSANCAFAEIGASLAPETLTHYAKQFGFSTEEAIPFELLAPSGLLAHDLTLLESEFQRAQTAFGQGQLLASPLHMALVAASVANGGHLPAPHLVQATHSNRNIFADIHSNHYWRRKVMNDDSAEIVRAMMINTVENGTGERAKIEGYTTGGKTGTAETSGAPHSWFIGFVEGNQTVYAIAVILENAGEGSRAAAAAFQQIGQATLSIIDDDPNTINTND